MKERRSVTAYPGVDALVAFGPLLILLLWLLGRTPITETVTVLYVAAVTGYPIYRWAT